MKKKVQKYLTLFQILFQHSKFWPFTTPTTYKLNSQNFEKKKYLNQQQEKLLKVAIYTRDDHLLPFILPLCLPWQLWFSDRNSIFPKLQRRPIDSPSESFLFHNEYEYTKKQVKNGKLCGLKILKDFLFSHFKK